MQYEYTCPDIPIQIQIQIDTGLFFSLGPPDFITKNTTAISQSQLLFQ